MTASSRFVSEKLPGDNLHARLGSVLLTSTEASWKEGAPPSGEAGFYQSTEDGLVGLVSTVTLSESSASGWEGQLTWYQSATHEPRQYVVGRDTFEFAFGEPPALPDGHRWYTAVMKPLTG